MFKFNNFLQTQVKLKHFSLNTCRYQWDENRKIDAYLAAYLRGTKVIHIKRTHDNWNIKNENIEHKKVLKKHKL